MRTFFFFSCQLELLSPSKWRSMIILEWYHLLNSLVICYTNASNSPRTSGLGYSVHFHPSPRCHCTHSVLYVHVAVHLGISFFLLLLPHTQDQGCSFWCPWVSQFHGREYLKKHWLNIDCLNTGWLNHSTNDSIRKATNCTTLAIQRHKPLKKRYEILSRTNT